MADDHGKKKKSKLGKAFKKAAKMALWGAFSFAVLGGMDFILFHGMAEGQMFTAAIKPWAEAFFSADIPIVGASIADGFRSSAEFIAHYSGASLSEAGRYATAAATEYSGTSVAPDFLSQFP